MGQALQDEVVLGRYLSGGVEVSCFSKRRLKSLAPGLPMDAFERVITAAGLESVPDLAAMPDSTPEELLPTRPKARFTLAGRSELELFFLDHIIVIVENPVQYKAMGINS